MPRKPQSQNHVQAPKPYEPTIEIKHVGFFLVPLADVYLDGELRQHELPLKEARPLNRGQLLEYAATFETLWDEFVAEHETRLRQGLSAMQNGEVEQ